MKLLTVSLEKRFKKIGRQSNNLNPTVVAHFFNAGGTGDWFATEYDPKSGLFFGYVSIFRDHNDELGYFSLEELESFKGKLGLGIERDIHWEEKQLQQVKNRLYNKEFTTK